MKTLALLMLRLIPLFLLLTTVSACDSSTPAPETLPPDEEPATDIIPLRSGDSFVYERITTETRYTSDGDSVGPSVTATVRWTTSVLQGNAVLDGDTDLLKVRERFGNDLETVYWYRLDGTGLYTLARLNLDSRFPDRRDTLRYAPPLQTLAFPLSEGQTWTFQEATDTALRLDKNVIGIGDRTVPAGTFTCTEVRGTYNDDRFIEPESYEIVDCVAGEVLVERVLSRTNVLQSGDYPIQRVEERTVLRSR
ncbi:MAG: hypothetical protein AAGN64_17825, partial [Bacteroidota bacterium]